jgi:uncharacterized protein (TIGR03083 family)
MDKASYLSALATESAAIATAAEGHLDSPVPTCPKWVVADLVAHVGRVYGWATGIVASAGQPPTGRGPDAPADRDALLPWYGEVREKLLDDLTRHDADDPAWVFVAEAPQKVGWWYRRQALESTVHRFDAQSASGEADPIDAPLAVEGIDEYLTGFLPRIVGRGPIDGLTGTLHVHATDAPGEWWLDLDAEGMAVRREHAKADTAVRGPSSGLYLWMCNRQTVQRGGLEVLGNASVVDAWRAVTF